MLYNLLFGLVLIGWLLLFQYSWLQFGLLLFIYAGQYVISSQLLRSNRRWWIVLVTLLAILLAGLVVFYA